MKLAELRGVGEGGITGGRTQRANQAKPTLEASTISKSLHRPNCAVFGAAGVEGYG